MSIGSVLKRWTTVPKHGILSPLRKVVGRSFGDELGGAVGFMVGGPAVAAAGAGLGSFAHDQNVGHAVGNAVKGYLGGTAANAALAGFGGGGLPGAMGEVNNAILKPAGSLGRTVLGIGGVPGAAGAATDAVGASGAARTGLGALINSPNLLPLLGLATNAAGAYATGRAQDNESKAANALATGQLDLLRQDRERQRSFDPLRMAIMNFLAQKKGITVPQTPTGG